MSSIQTVIFDYGAVIFDIDFKRTIQAFKDLGIADADEIFGHLSQHQVFDEFDRGNITPAEFRTELRKWINQPVNDAQIDAAWNELLIGIPEGKLSLLARVKSKYTTFLLSNNNMIHYDWIQAYLKRECQLDSIDVYFRKTYYSQFMGMRKPDAIIFETVLKEQQLNPATTLFIDDSPQHIKTAASLGIQTLHLLHIDLLAPELKKLGVL